MTAYPRSRRSLLAAVVLGAPVAVAGACSSSAPPVAEGNPPAVDAGLTSSDGGGSPVVDGAEASVDAADASTVDTSLSDAADAAAPVDAGADTAPVCNPSASVGTTPALVLGTPDPDLMGGISDDQLVIAWTSLVDAGPVVHWAERDAAADPFGASQTLDAKFGAVAPDHVALRGDGLRLVFASADRTQLFEVARTARGAPFTTNQPNEDFLGVNPHTEGSNVDPGYSPFGSPSLGSSFKTMWAFVNGNAGFVVSQNELGVWSGPTFPPSLAPSVTDRYLAIPTGWSIDGRTLFYWDNGSSVERAAWRDPTSVTFSSAKDLGAEQYAVPSSDCASVYYSAPGANTDLDLFVAPFK